MKKRFSRFVIFTMLLVIALISLLFFISATPSLRQQAAEIPSFGLSRVSQLWRTPWQLVEGASQQVKDLFQTYADNQVLKQRLSEMGNQENRIQGLEEENQRLRQALNIQDVYKEHVTLHAEILVRSSVAWLEEVTLDKGSEHGVSSGMFLVSDKGLIGKVGHIAAETTQVWLLTNTVSSQAIPVKITGDLPVYGIILGYDQERQALKIGQLNSQDDIIQDSLVETSGLDGETVAGIPVGKVQSVERLSDQSRVVYVTLSANMTDLSAVSLVGR